MFTVNINKNNSLKELQTLVEQNSNRTLSYMPDSFNEQQRVAIELFKKRIFLEQIIDEAITFNRNLNFPNENKNLHLATTAEDLIDVFKLRSDVYTGINYQSEFPDIIEGINFDTYDSNSAILFYKSNKEITGTIRLISDSQKKLPSEDKFSFESERKNNAVIAELSRLIVSKNKNSLNLEFKNLTQGIYYLAESNNVNLILSGIKEEHFKLYSKFGGISIEKKLGNYGTFTIPCLILSWDPSQISPFFKKAFLR